jgi:preprotein translocase subunit YajC
MQALIVLTLSFGLLWVLFLLPQKRQMREHQQLVASLNEGDEVILSAGIYGRITELGAEELLLEVAPGVELRVARQAVLRRVELAVPSADPGADDATDVEASAAEPPVAASSDAATGVDEPDIEPSPPTSSDGTAQSPSAEPPGSPARDLHA